MIDIASQATKGAKIPNQKLTRATIKQTFKDHLIGIRARLNVRIISLFIDIFSYHLERDCQRKH